MWAAVLGDPSTGGQEPGRGDPFHRIGGLRDQSGRLGPARFLGHGRVGHQLRQAA